MEEKLCALSDEELEKVNGGGLIQLCDSSNDDNPKFICGIHVRMKNRNKTGKIKGRMMEKDANGEYVYKVEHDPPKSNKIHISYNPVTNEPESNLEKV